MLQKIQKQKPYKPVLPELLHMRQFVPHPAFTAFKFFFGGVPKVYRATQHHGYSSKFQISGSQFCKEGIFPDADDDWLRSF